MGQSSNQVEGTVFYIFLNKFIVRDSYIKHADQYSIMHFYEKIRNTNVILKDQNVPIPPDIMARDSLPILATQFENNVAECHSNHEGEQETFNQTENTTMNEDRVQLEPV